MINVGWTARPSSILLSSKEARDGSSGRGAQEVGEVLCAGILITVSTNSASSKPGQCILLDENMHQPA